jgi:hypothetical protein
MRLTALAAAAVFVAGFAASANAAPVTLTGVNPVTNAPNSVSFDTNGAPTKVEWAQGGVFAGLPQNRRAACDAIGGGVRADGTLCVEAGLAGYQLGTAAAVELTRTNPGQVPQDILASFFSQPLVNGAGNDLLIFETFNQSDSPAVRITIGGADLLGVALSVVEVNGKRYTVWGYDFSLAGFVAGALLGSPIFITTAANDGSADIAGIVGLNFGVVPVPAALPLFLSGVAAIGWARRRKKAA